MTPTTPSATWGTPRSSRTLTAARRSWPSPQAFSVRLLLVHGLADDNVFAAHTVALSRALLAAGHAHCVLPLPGITHVAGRDDVAEQLLWPRSTSFAGPWASPQGLSPRLARRGLGLLLSEKSLC